MYSLINEIKLIKDELRSQFDPNKLIILYDLIEQLYRLQNGGQQ